MSEEQKDGITTDTQPEKGIITVNGEAFDKKELAKSLLCCFRSVLFQSDGYSKEELNSYFPAFVFMETLLLE